QCRAIRPRDIAPEIEHADAFENSPHRSPSSFVQPTVDMGGDGSGSRGSHFARSRAGFKCRDAEAATEASVSAGPTIRERQLLRPSQGLLHNALERVKL